MPVDRARGRWRLVVWQDMAGHLGKELRGMASTGTAGFENIPVREGAMPDKVTQLPGRFKAPLRNEEAHGRL
jgi:hypothetical protein